MDVSVYVAKATSTSSESGYPAGEIHGMLVVVDTSVYVDDNDWAADLEKSGWADVRWYKKGSISPSRAFSKGEDFIAAYSLAKQGRVGVIVYSDPVEAY
jgi:hypothetical protein